MTVEPIPGPATIASLRDQGWTESAVRTAVRRGRLERARQGVYRAPVPAGSDRSAAHLELARAAVHSSPRSCLSHRAAAVAHGLPVLGLPAPPCLTVPSGTALRDLERCHLHRAALPAEDLADLGGLPLTAVPRTIVDVAREHGAGAGVVAADHALRLGLTAPDELRQVADRCRRWPGARSARDMLTLADPSAESPLESLSRLRLWAAGLPPFRTQAVVRDRSGLFVARLDFFWDEQGVAGEADGRLKYLDPDALSREKDRQDQLSELGIRMVRWGWRELAHFRAVAERLARRLATPPTHRDWIC